MLFARKRNGLVGHVALGVNAALGELTERYVSQIAQKIKHIDVGLTAERLRISSQWS